ncbi:MAG: ABC transporter ATP-binding protein [Chlorobi bacterium]|nr:ABC transporter ATP-binding protein [Chlorobiota bacterium]
MSQKSLLEVGDLVTQFKTDRGIAKAVNGVSFDVYSNEVLGIVGESGSGKSVTALSVMRLIPNPPGDIVNGSIKLEGKEILDLPIEEMRELRGNEIGMIFQEPMTSLNSVFTIGFQMKEGIMLHQEVDEATAMKKSAEMLDMVGIPSPEKRLNDYPHQFSGGMRQRVMIAMALSNNPKLLIADEPTTALDVTIQAQILELMLSLQKQREGASIILITHDLAVVAETCDRVIVMYGGKIQEIGTVRQVFKNPLHPYTHGLLESIPHPVEGSRLHRLKAIRGNVPNIMELPKACKFNTRCDYALKGLCFDVEPELAEIEPGHFVRCHLYEESTELTTKEKGIELSV